MYCRRVEGVLLGCAIMCCPCLGVSMRFVTLPLFTDTGNVVGGSESVDAVGSEE